MYNENAFWSYDKARHLAKDGMRWHFVRRHSTEAPFEEQPYEVYFRDDARTFFGLIRFESLKDYPYSSWETLVYKVMNNKIFRETHAAPETKNVWAKSWK